MYIHFIFVIQKECLYITTCAQECTAAQREHPEVMGGQQSTEVENEAPCGWAWFHQCCTDCEGPNSLSDFLS